MSGASEALDTLRKAGMIIKPEQAIQNVGGFSIEKDGQQIAVFLANQGEQALQRAIAVKGCLVVLVDPRKPS
jgi:hypothetical protein